MGFWVHSPLIPSKLLVITLNWENYSRKFLESIMPNNLCHPDCVLALDPSLVDFYSFNLCISSYFFFLLPIIHSTPSLPPCSPPQANNMKNMAYILPNKLSRICFLAIINFFFNLGLYVIIRSNIGGWRHRGPKMLPCASLDFDIPNSPCQWNSLYRNNEISRHFQFTNKNQGTLNWK